MNASSSAALALIAYAVHEHQAGSATRITVTLKQREVVIEDDGRGMGLDRPGYVVGLIEQLGGQQPDVALHGIGLAILALSSPVLTIESHRGGALHRQSFAWGRAQGPVGSVPATAATTGTRVTMTLPDGAPDVDLDHLLAPIASWRAAHPRLTIDLQCLP